MVEETQLNYNIIDLKIKRLMQERTFIAATLPIVIGGLITLASNFEEIELGNAMIGAGVISAIFLGLLVIWTNKINKEIDKVDKLKSRTQTQSLAPPSREPTPQDYAQ